MLYMVECGFSDPSREQAWNEWYGGQRLDELLSVPGFRGSQRFRALGGAPVRYLAVHWIDSLEVFKTPAYRAIGGGGFQGYQDCITDWVRRFFSGWDQPLAVAARELLLVADGDRAALADGALDWVWLAEAGAHSPRERAVARIDASRLGAIHYGRQAQVRVYSPLIAWRAGRQS